MKYLSIFFLTLVSVETMYSQDTTAIYKNYFGFSASRVSGVGLTFGSEPIKYITFQVTGGIFQTSSRGFFSYGLELQYNIHNTNSSRLYIGPAIGGFNNSYELGTKTENSTSEFVVGLAMGVAAPIIRVFDNRIRISGTFYYPAFYKDNSIGVGFAGTIHFLF